jgi:PPP family 3-phenylpropionic acid transporter
MPRPPPIALVWFFSLAGLGVFFPYFSLYLKENAGFTGTQVGIALAVLPLVGIVAPPLWGQLADRTGLRSRVLVLLGFGAALGYAMLYFARGFPAIVLGTAALACFSTALLPICVSVTLALTRKAGPFAFGLMRVWGTLGFLVLVTSLPPMVDALQEWRGLETVSGGPSEPGLEVMFPMTGALVLIGALIALALPRSGALEMKAPRGDWRRLLRHRPFVRLLGFALLGYLFLQGPMGLFPIFVRSHGGSIDSVSHMWILMLLPEIPLIALSGAIVARIGPRGLLALGVLAGGLRWTVCGFADDLVWIYLAQLLHGVVVAGLVIGGPLYVDAAVPPRLRSTGQGMLAMIGVSVGGISSNLGSGWLLDRAGADAPYIVGGLGALLLGCLILLLLPPASRPEPLLDEDEAG